MNDPRGSIWRKWDLQVQTRLDKRYSCLSTSSLNAEQLALLQTETGLTETEITSQEKTISTEKYAQLLVACVTLFTDIRVIGITDHNTGKELDAIIAESEKGGKLTIIPGVEVGSTQGIHMLCLFDPEKKWKNTWSESIEHLLTDFGISTGFNQAGQPLNSSKSCQEIMEIVEAKGGITIFAHVGTENGLFKNSPTANGGTAHSEIYKHDLCRIIQMPRTATLSAGTQNIIDGKDPHYGNKIVAKIKCSDSRKLTEIGSDFVWLKADPTFEGLKQIIYEPEERVFIGQEPAIETRVRENQRRYIASLEIDQIEGYDNRWGIWFKNEKIELNKELVAIIGNKGNGKSALTDIIGLLGNSHNQKYQRDGKPEELFSFLNNYKFLKGNCASNFTATLHWYAGSPDTTLLNRETDESITENVEYLPQKYLEKICANIEDDEFRHKLNEVIFEYVNESDRFGQGTLDELIKYLTNQTDADIGVAKAALHEANSKVVSIEKKLTPDHKKDVEERVRLKQADIDAHKEAKPKKVSKPAEGGDATEKSAKEIKTLEEQISELSAKIQEAQNESATLTRQAEDLRQAQQTIERQANAVTALKSKYESLFKDEGIVFSNVVSITTSYKEIEASIKKKEKRLEELAELLKSNSQIEVLGLAPGDELANMGKSLLSQRDALEAKRKEIIDRLDSPNKTYQAYLAAETQWQARQKELEGETTDPAYETLNWWKQELQAVTSTYPKQLETARLERSEASKAVFEKKKSLVSFYEDVKSSIDEEIRKYGTDLGEYNITIEAGLKFDSSLYEEFFSYINQQSRGTFHGTEDGRGQLQKSIESIPDWENESVVEELEKLVKLLHVDVRAGQPSDDIVRDVFKQMKQRKDLVDLYDYIFGFDYLETKYDLKVDEKDLKELSPGERGGLLLIFYLMLDRRDIPLVIDQPEDNLDNKSIYEILVTFLKKAKKRRQIIMVTHNPNLAVVADAEQIIYVSIDKKDKKNDFDVVSGAIENPVINRLVVDILEGTLPAFDNRRLKYRKQTV